jgi:ABC-type amino acid transport system permease subunit
MSEETVAQNTTVGGGSVGLEVEGEPGVYWCARHKSVKTRLRCGRCEKPICPKCTTYGPTGARCRECVSYKGSHMYQVAPQQYVAAIVTSLALGLVSSYIAAFIGLFAIFYAPVAGTFIGKAVSAVVKHKRGTPLAAIAAAGLVLGALPHIFGGVIRMMAIYQAMGDEAIGLSGYWLSGGNPVFMLIYLALAIPSVWYWLK